MVETGEVRVYIIRQECFASRMVGGSGRRDFDGWCFLRHLYSIAFCQADQNGSSDRGAEGRGQPGSVFKSEKTGVNADPVHGEGNVREGFGIRGLVLAQLVVHAWGIRPEVDRDSLRSVEASGARPNRST